VVGLAAKQNTARGFWTDLRSVGSHRTLSRPGWPNYVFSFHDKRSDQRCWRVLPSERAWLEFRLCRERVLRLKIPRQQSEVARNTLGVVIGFTGVILTFSLVQEQSNLRNIEPQVGAEAHDLAQMDRLFTRYGAPAADAIRSALRDYANSISTQGL